MTPAIDQLSDDIKALKKIIIEGFTHRDQENALLKEQIKLLQAMLYGRKTEKMQPATDDHQLRLDFGDEPVAEQEQALPAAKETKVPVKGHSRRKGSRKPLPSYPGGIGICASCASKKLAFQRLARGRCRRRNIFQHS